MKSQRMSLVVSLLALAGLAIFAGNAWAVFPSVSVQNNLPITPGGTLNITNKAEISKLDSLATVNGYVSSSYNNGFWNLPGLTSSTAANNITKNTGLAVLTGAEYKVLGNSFYGMDLSSAAADTWNLAAYVYAGDANLDGVVSGSDMSRLIAGSGGAGNTWYYGDFNHDGSISGSDMSLLITGYSTQGTEVSGAKPFNPRALSTSPVPEPTTIALLLSGFALVLIARRRHRA
jgi:hypothetical protein